MREGLPDWLSFKDEDWPDELEYEDYDYYVTDYWDYTMVYN